MAHCYGDALMPSEPIDLGEVPRHPDALLTTAQVAAVLGTSPGNLKKMRCKGIGPAFLRIPGVGLRCKRGTVDQWLAEMAVAA